MFDGYFGNYKRALIIDVHFHVVQDKYILNNASFLIITTDSYYEIAYFIVNNSV